MLKVVGSHNVLTDYESMLRNATASARKVAARILSGLRSKDVSKKTRQANTAELSAEITTGFGDVLMGRGNGGDDAIVTVYVVRSTGCMLVKQSLVCDVCVSFS